ncbi:hypothetical protein NMY22_g12093 [Coprinellus aureogranulatus]|nr:hypothetical protein NMY22_g12093 [Coprinellus aureogranulatus]
MDALCDALSGLTFSSLDTSRYEDGRQYLINARTFRLTPRTSILLVAKKISQSATSAGDGAQQTQRLYEHIESIIRGHDSDMNIGFSRTKAHLIAATIEELQLSGKSLHLALAQRVVERVSGLFIEVWNVGITFANRTVVNAKLSYYQAAATLVKANARGTTAERNCVSLLSYLSALLADLYAQRLINVDEFVRIVRFALDKARTRILFHVLIFHFLARAFTGSGQKLPPREWTTISNHWNALSGGANRPSLASIAIQLFSDDAKQESHICAIEWGMEYEEDEEEAGEGSDSGDVDEDERMEGLQCPSFRYV